MTEACEAVTDFWFNTFKFPVLRVTKAVANVASSRISEKSGMRMSPRKSVTIFPGVYRPKSGRHHRRRMERSKQTQDRMTVDKSPVHSMTPIWVATVRVQGFFQSVSDTNSSRISCNL